MDDSFCPQLLTVSELKKAETHLILTAQTFSFEAELKAFMGNSPLPRSSCLISFRPFLDSSGLLRVGGRQELSGLQFDRRHPIVLHGSHLSEQIIIILSHLTKCQASSILA